MIDILIVILFFAIRIPLPLVMGYTKLSYLQYRGLADLILLIMMLILFRIKGPYSHILYAWKKPKFRDLYLGIVCTVVLFSLAMSISNISHTSVIIPSFFTHRIYVVYLILMLTSINEELFYRGYLFSLLLRHHISHSYTIVIVSLLFGISHLYLGIGGVVFGTIAGGILGFAVVRYNSLFLVSISHILYNALIYTIQVISHT